MRQPLLRDNASAPAASGILSSPDPEHNRENQPLTPNQESKSKTTARKRSLFLKGGGKYSQNLH